MAQAWVERHLPKVNVEKEEKERTVTGEESNLPTVENWVKQQNIAGERDEHNINVQMQVNASGGNCCLHLVLPPGQTPMEVVDTNREDGTVQDGNSRATHTKYEPQVENITPPGSPSTIRLSPSSEVEETWAEDTDQLMEEQHSPPCFPHSQDYPSPPHPPQDNKNQEVSFPLQGPVVSVAGAIADVKNETLPKPEEGASQDMSLCRHMSSYRYPTTPTYTYEEDIADKVISNVTKMKIGLMEKLDRALQNAQLGVSSTKAEYDRGIERLSDLIVGLEVMLGDIKDSVKALQENLAGEMLNLENAKTDDLTNKCKIIGDLVAMKQHILEFQTAV